MDLAGAAIGMLVINIKMSVIRCWQMLS